jgi:hypothetical protein
MRDLRYDLLYIDLEDPLGVLALPARRLCLLETRVIGDGISGSLLALPQIRCHFGPQSLG